MSIITAGSLWAEYQMVSVNHFGWFNNTRFMFMMKRMSYGWPPTVVSHDLLAAFWYRGLNAHYKIYTLYKYLKENETGGYLIFYGFGSIYWNKQKGMWVIQVKNAYRPKYTTSLGDYLVHLIKYTHTAIFYSW